MLVLSKVYLVTKGAIVPLMAQRPRRLPDCQTLDRQGAPTAAPRRDHRARCTRFQCLQREPRLIGRCATLAIVSRSWKGCTDAMRRGRLSESRENPEPRPENWEVSGVDPAHVAAEWKKLGFDPFEAAMAQGDGFTPAFRSSLSSAIAQDGRLLESGGLGLR